MGGYLTSRCCCAKCLTTKKRMINASRPANVPTTAPMMVFVLPVEEGLVGEGRVAGALAGT